MSAHLDSIGLETVTDHDAMALGLWQRSCDQRLKLSRWCRAARVPGCVRAVLASDLRLCQRGQELPRAVEVRHL
jgi:hypothetical protein